MSYMLRDRPDGQFEIVLSRPILVGIFPEKDVAARVMFFLQEGEVEPVDDNAASFGQALRDAAAVEDETEIELLEEIEIVDPAPPLTPLPAVVAKAAPPMIVSKHLTKAELETVFARISAGEKLAVVAPDFGLSLGQLRSVWAMQCRAIQQHLAEGGQVPCKLCRTSFTPSISHPDTCARCSRD